MRRGFSVAVAARVLAKLPANKHHQSMDKLAILKQILEQNPTDSFARYGLAMELVSQSRIPEALAEFETCIRNNPDYVPAYQMSAQTMAAHGQTDAAVQRLHEGLARRIAPAISCAGGDGCAAG